MEEWSVPGSGSEDEEGEEGATGSDLNFGGIKIPPQRLLELIQSVQQRKTVELDSLNDTYQKKRHKKKKKKRKKRVGGADASETASEIRSTTCTSTTETRDIRRTQLFDDPELDDYDTPAASKPLLPTRKKAPPLTHKKVGQLASLDKITADMKKRKQQWQIREQTEGNQSLPTNAARGDHDRRDRFLQPNSTGNEIMEVEGEGMARNVEDSDKESSDSESDMKVALMSQLNKVEQLLDFEVS